MERQRTHRRPERAGDTGPERVAGPSATPSSEAIHVRSYDHQWSYDLDVTVLTEEGEEVFDERYYLQPGRLVSESAGIPDGEYEVRVTLDNARQERLECRIDRAPAHTAVIEVGNGAVSLTEGLEG